MQRFVFAAFSLLLALPAFAQLQVADPWVRATVPQQQATGAFMRLTSPIDARVVEVRSPAARIVEIHEMTLQDNVMRMRAVKALDLPAGKAVHLQPGGYHVMLIDLVKPLKEGETVPLTLVVEGKDQRRETVEVQAPVRPLTAMPHSMHSGGK
jgi:copper(I)-binding protein